MEKLLNLIKKNYKVCIGVGGVILIIIVAIILGIMLQPKEGEFTVISESSLREVLEIEELSTLEYFYNSIATQNIKDSDKIKYHVRYEGMVRLGIEFDDIAINVDDDNKKIIVTVPEIKVIDCSVDQETMEFIFIKEKYETESVLVEAYKLCKEDLEEKVVESNSLFELAKENAVSSIEALLLPWIEQVDEEYVVTVE